ncbi:MAG: hypothetical protein FWF52_05735 [Candidatus Azobacteroides sp.]|nr:hypothetical protein [Candidatus Azobacteroides sp.]
MKKIFLLIMIIGFFSACTKEVTEEITEVTAVVEPNVYSKTYTVEDANWKVGNDDMTGIYYYCTFNEPKLTSEVFEYGIMQAFLCGRNINSLSPLPYSDFVIDDDTNYQWEEHFTVEFEEDGNITFILKVSDHANMLDKDGNQILPYYTKYQFLVRFLW